MGKQSKVKKLTTKDIAEAYRVANRAEKKLVAHWEKKVKLLRPKEGDILIVPAEAGIDLFSLSRVLQTTKIMFALVAPKGKVSLMSREDGLKFAKAMLKQDHGKSKKGRKTTRKRTPKP